MSDLPNIFTLLAHQAEIRRIWELVQPVIADIKRVYPEEYTLIKNLLTALGYIQPDRIQGALASFDTRWLQEALKKLGSPDLLADSNYGPATHDAVSKFQREHPPLKPDGIAGVQTIAAIAIELGKL